MPVAEEPKSAKVTCLWQENLNQLRSPMPVAGESKSAKVTYAYGRSIYIS